MGGGAKTGLPWERGYPPKFQSHPLQKRAPHWNIGRAVRCTQCGARGGCMHTNAHERKINEKWEELAEGKDNRPDFFGELPQGEGSPRRHGEWKLVFVPRDKSRDLRAEEIEAELSKKKRSKSSLSKNPIADKIARARREWEEDSVPVPAFERDSRAQSMTPSGGLRVPDTWEEIKETKFASVMQRDYFFSAKLRGDPRALPPSTPDLVHSLNQLNRSDGHTSLPTIVTADKSTFLPRTEKASAGLPRQRVRGRQDFEARLGESVRHMESLNKNSRGHSENSLSKDVFRSVPGDNSVKGRYSYVEPLLTTLTRGSAAPEWLDDSSRTQRLDCLQAKIKPVRSLKTNIRRGDVKAADGALDMAKARNPAARRGPDGLMQPKFVPWKAGQALENYYWSQARQPIHKHPPKMGQDFRF